MTEQELALLELALRSRPQTVAALQKLSALPNEDFIPALSALEKARFLSVSDGGLSYHRPENTVADHTRQTVEDLARQLATQLARTQETLAHLPRLLQAWHEGATDAHHLHVAVNRGESAPADIWRLQSNRMLPRTADICMPFALPMFSDNPARTHSHWNAGAAEPTQVRFILGTKDVSRPGARERLQQEVMAGVTFRMHPSAPSYFWITDDIVGLPARWGEVWPEEVTAIRSPALAAALTLVFDRVWSEALPLDAEPEQPWDGMLHLMSLGMTMESAAHALGLTARTGRRRVAAAMEHFNASSHFTLGAAWHAARAS